MSIRKLFYSTKTSQYKIIPRCEECENYIKYFIDSYSRCKKFKYYNDFKEELDFEYADHARKISKLCSLEGKYFKYNKNYKDD
jgi:hypothetical protein